ncbi:MAG TPA: DUF1697 domain-containing protein [Ktedonobacterales bacterium]|jgi:uncharacterized protein (DUF1697 family)|nr:DUF1697 domain-containing protein [Ktedonobacterales bacterium]
MTTYIALLRGINVGGRNMIKMAELKRLFEKLGLDQVQTYIQSGNVLFTAEEEEQPLRQRLEREIEAIFGFPVTVVLRTAAELQQIIAECPFASDALQEGESLYLTLLADVPSKEGIERLLSYSSEVDDYRIVGRSVYLLYRRSILDSKLTNAFLEQRLGVRSTARNWRTISALAAKAQAMEA